MSIANGNISRIATATKRPIKLYDSRLENAQTPQQVGRINNQNFARLEKAIQPVLLQSPFSIPNVAIHGGFRLGTIVQLQNTQSAVLADASNNVAANAIVTDVKRGNIATVAPLAVVNVSLSNIPAVQGYQEIFLGDNGNIVATEPETGYIQKLGFIIFFNQSAQVYSVVFQPCAPVFVGTV